ncbi:hypothetical protein D9619_002789 [Psilocybe cf. subviscida]|uniref:Uncharacterized protein n=1 Tax=Psilocybe cf. subviscida TaxID=2480587 RepID=A0A8H5AVR8_9AGAR|nr:hypothetical protein D9619_002789 [Psilocybe cf. subviscida]
MPQLFRARRRSHHVGHNTANNSNGLHHAAGGTARDAFTPLQSYLPTSAPRYASGASHFSTPPPLDGSPKVSSSYSGSGQARELHHDHDLQAGAEPGVNPRSGKSAAEYGHFKQNCVIDVIDYDCDDVIARRYDNEGFIALLAGEKNRRGESSDDADSGDDDDDVSLPPRMVRWINIGGIDWDVLSNVALKYNLHSLTLEDILHEQGHTHSKADYYPGHLFIRVLSHTLSREHYFKHHVSLHHHNSGEEHHDHHTHGESTQTQTPNITATSPGHHTNDNSSQHASHPEINLDESPTSHLPKLDLEGGGGSVHAQDMEGRASEDSIDKTHATPSPPLTASSSENGAARSSKGKVKSQESEAEHETAHPHVKKMFGYLKSHLSLRKRMTALSGIGGPDREKRRHELEALKDSEHRVVVKTWPIFVYLLPDGTVISLQSAASLEYTAPIAERLHRPDSVLRTSEDASLLVESLLDLVVDRVLEVVDEYQAAISHLERDILLYPVMHSVRALHILSGDLIMHKRTLQPIHTMISGLRQYDLERCRAVADNVAAERRFMMSGPDDSETDFGGDAQMSDDENETETEAETRRSQEQDDNVQGGRRILPGSPASASSSTSTHHQSSPKVQSVSTSSSATARGSGKGSDNVHAKDYMVEEDIEPEAELEEKAKRDRKKDKKRKSKKKTARVVADPPPEYDVKAKAQRRRQRKRAWLRAERSRPVPAEHRNAGAPGAFSPEGGAPSAPGAHGPAGGTGYSPSPPYHGTGSQHHDERGYMSPLHRHMRHSTASSSTSGYTPRSARLLMSAQRPPRVVGYFSYKAKVYLADVTDHMDFALSSLETFAGITENLIDYAFNMASYDMNIVMNRLTLVTIIFLPLTLMTGYFGMNFTPFWSVDQHSDLFFWTVALPVMAFLIPVFMLGEIRKGVRNLKRRYDTQQAIRHHYRR